MSGTFTADVELFGGGSTAIGLSSSVAKSGVELVGFTSKGAQLTVPKQGVYSVELYSLNGKKLYSVNSSFTQGSNLVNWNRSLAKGIYLTKIKGNGVNVVLRHAVSK